MKQDKNEQWNDYQENFDRIANLTSSYFSPSNTKQREKRNVMARHMRKDAAIQTIQSKEDLKKNLEERELAMKSYLAQCKAKGIKPHINRIS